MADTKQFSRLTKITKGNTPSTDLKMTDIFAMQHIDLPSGANAYKQVSLAQSLCEPIAVTPNSTPSDGAYTATCSNYPDFSLTYTDANGNSHYLIGLKVRVVFTKGITYGSVSGGTYPTLNINGSGAIPLLAQGMTMAKGAAQNGQTIEFTIIPYGNGVAFDADSNVRESTSDYTIYTDGLKRVDVVEKNNKNMVTSNATYRANEGEKLFTIRLQGWDSNNQPYDVLTVSRAGYKIANNVYVILAILEPTTSMPAPSSILNLIKVDDISGIQSATLYARGRGVQELPIPQISGDKFYMRIDSGNWLPSTWQDSYIVASFIVKL